MHHVRRFRAAALCSVLLAWTGISGTADQPPIPSAPAFSATQLLARPTSNWITNGGTLYNQRYSPLTLLNRENVGQLHALWRTAMGSGTTQGHAGQTQILAYEGVLYVSNGAGDVFAMDVETGAMHWSYKGNPDQRAGSPIGRANRGVALGDGKVFFGLADGRLTALDQRSGQPVWQIQAERWQDGFSITAAPLYFDGKVIIGTNGGEMGTRGRIKAYDAKTGALQWTFYTVPGPGEFGHETWPKDSDAWTRGGANIWQTPALDPELGLLYFSTANPGPDLNGSVREGDNLFANSIVAIEVKTGKYRWHFQQVHHDLWDYDSPNPVVLFDAPYAGVMRKGLVQVSKTGWAYILDRVTGKPLIGIDEKPVPQEPRQKTAATQPYPRGDAIVPQEIDIVPEGATLVPGTGDLPNRGRIFTPFWDKPISVKPGTMGGANWPPSSYDPDTHLLYACASDRISDFVVRLPLETPGPNKVYMGGQFTQAQVDDAGVFAALDVTTNRIVWRQQWREICYSGSVVTAGGLVFIGRADGRLTALDKRTGAKLWEFMTDAGVNTTVTTFEHKGKQYVVVHAGGGSFANGKRGDGIWMFSLDGKIGPIVASVDGAPAGGGRGGAPVAAAAAPDKPLDLAAGESIYKVACLACHGADGTGGHGGGPTLIGKLDAAQIRAVTMTGRNNMPTFRGIYDANQIRDVAEHIVQQLASKPQ
ncbi:MAG: PQQ-binding-like beta-propeller repeat protein [Steroidobacteraceae bacterium]